MSKIGKLLLCILISGVLGITGAQAQNKMKITFVGYSNRTETLTNFPVLVIFSNNMGGTSFNFQNNKFLMTNGWDLRFCDSNQQTYLNYEIERWTNAVNTNAYVWVQVPLLKTNTDYIWARWAEAPYTNRMYYTTNGATWDTTFSGVWHLAATNSFTNTVPDSTSSNHAGVVLRDSGPTNGMVDGGWDFHGDNQGYALVSMGNNVGVMYNASRTLSGWTKHKTGAQNLYPTSVFGQQGYGGDGSYFDLECGIPDDGNGGNSYVFYEGGQASTAYTKIDSLGSNIWKYIAITYDGGTSNLNAYVNSQLLVTNTIPARTIDTMSYDSSNNPCGPVFALGFKPAQWPFNGSVDEVRMENVVRSSNWIWACWMTMADNTVFSTYGDLGGYSAGPPLNPPVYVYTPPPASTANGIPYSWLASYGISNTSDSVENEDLNGNGLNILQDYIAGLDPTNSNSRFRVSITNASGQTVVSVQSIQTTGTNYGTKMRFYGIQQCLNLLTGGAWQQAPGCASIQATGNVIAYTNATQDSAKFYRAKAWLQ